ncbi:hypothetical protein HLH32_03160 [Gluconacetobacter liquefaciens]|uniref:Membrane AbrB-like protein n=1 Tax=Gluconacetobacter liquefaciens TaxID=89584 RepID=A0A7W4P934_GLULI|nr:hypothetical protein [Gluconacetobacter liquefaciens]
MSDAMRGAEAMRRLLLRWVLLLGGSMALAELLRRIGLPASAMLGPMICGIVAGVTGQGLRLPGPVFPLALGVVGCLIATSLPLSVLASILDKGPVFFAGVVSIVLVSAAAGFVLARTGVLPGTTALWGSSPGAATPMTIMSASYGADMRLVAFMQYLRVIFVSGSAAAVTRFFAVASAGQDALVRSVPRAEGGGGGDRRHATDHRGVDGPCPEIPDSRWSADGAACRGRDVAGYGAADYRPARMGARAGLYRAGMGNWPAFHAPDRAACVACLALGYPVHPAGHRRVGRGGVAARIVRRNGPAFCLAVV